MPTTICKTKTSLRIQQNKNAGLATGTLTSALNAVTGNMNRQLQIVRRANFMIDKLTTCPKCHSSRIFLLRIDCDWGSGVGNYDPVNPESEYKPEDLELDSFDRPDVETYHCLDCGYMW